MRLTNGQADAPVLAIVFDELLIEIAPEFASRIVLDIQQLGGIIVVHPPGIHDPRAGSQHVENDQS
ncbi:hypothetical protein BH10PLA2_BH10PLA2_23270 [soil metagenome]